MATEVYYQFLSIAVIHLFAVMSPGPDFALIVKQSLSHGRKTALATSIGIGTGILFHIFYCIVGIGLIISKNPYIFNIIKISGGLYLIYIGYKSIVSISNQTLEDTANASKLSSHNAFFEGLVTNILNPKATLFFLSLYTFIINEQPEIYIQILYGAWMSLATAAWFCFISILLTNSLILKPINNFTNIIQRITGIGLILIGIRLILI